MKDKNVEAARLLITLGASPAHKGFRYLVEVIENFDRHNRNMTSACRDTAKQNGTTCPCVQRDIRTTLSYMRRRGWMERFNEMFGAEVINAKTQIHAKDFVALCSEYIHRIEKTE